MPPPQPPPLNPTVRLIEAAVAFLRDTYPGCRPRSLTIHLDDGREIVLPLRPPRPDLTPAQARVVEWFRGRPAGEACQAADLADEVGFTYARLRGELAGLVDDGVLAATDGGHARGPNFPY